MIQPLLISISYSSSCQIVCRELAYNGISDYNTYKIFANFPRYCRQYNLFGWFNFNSKHSVGKRFYDFTIDLTTN